MLRLFIGLELPDAARDRLAMLQNGIPDVRWLDPATFHVTLRFIGEVDEGVAADIDTALGRTDVPAPPIAIGGVGHFGTDRRPNVLWAGVQRNEALQFLHDKVDRAVVGAGLAPEARRYHPHVSLARPKAVSAPRLQRWLGANAAFAVPSFQPDDFVLFESLTGREGAVYRPLAGYPLRPAPDD